MLKLKSYSFSGIGRFVEKQTIDLEDRDHLIQIDGENNNTGGSSGAGKSTTVEALAFLLGISDIPSTQLQSRITKSPIWVQGEFEGGITITRSKKDGLTIETPEGTVSGNSKLAEEKLDEIIGVDRGLLKTMCYKRQKQGGFFLNLTPKQSHAFLVECLDLSDYQKKIELMNEALKDKFKPRKIQLNSAVEVLAGNVGQFKMLLKEKIKPEKPDLPKVENVKLELKVMEQKLEGLEVNRASMFGSLGPKPDMPTNITFEGDAKILEYTSLIKQTKQLIQNNIEQKQNEIEQAASAIVSIQEKLNDAKRSQDEIVKCQQQLEELKAKKDHIDCGNCPTCRRNWEADAEALSDIETKIENYNNAINFHKEQIQKIPVMEDYLKKGQQILEEKKSAVINTEEESRLTNLQNEMNNLLNEKNNIESIQNQKYLEELNNWNNKANLINNEFSNQINELNSEIANLKSDIRNIEQQEQSYKNALETYNTDIQNINSKLEKAQQELVEKASEIEQIDKDIVLAEESIRLIQNFTLQKFQDTLNYIGNRATQIINMIPNMANAVISFENAKQTKTGSIKNEVNAVINLEGDSKIPIKTLSGGERTSADFAVDLAVGEMIESMTQKGVNFLIIDEGLDGLDSISKIECIEILKTLNTDKKILMVDHSNEVKEMVHDIIKVKRTGEESVIV